MIAQMLRHVTAFALIAGLAACVENPPTGLGPGAGDAKVVAGVTLDDSPRSTGKPFNPAIRYVGGDGSSIASAILIKGAHGEYDGVRSEYDWIAMNLPGWKSTDQALLTEGARVYDALTLRKAGATKVVYFDITEYFGK